MAARKTKPHTSPRLIWSPNGAGHNPKSAGQRRIFESIDSATTPLDVYALLLDYRPFQDRLQNAAKRGVSVRVLTNASTQPNASNPFTYAQLVEMSAAGIKFPFNPKYNGGSLFVHSKTIIRDAVVASDRMAFVGSDNPGDYVSMNAERELGVLVANEQIMEAISGTFATDWASAEPLQFKDGKPVNPFVKP